MKKILLAFLFIAQIFFVNGQQWALPSSTWLCTSFDQMYGEVTFVMKIDKDTVVANMPCKKFNRPGYYKYSGDLYTYEANDTVFFFLKGRFRPTYCFNVSVGDTVSYFDGWDWGNNGDTTVDARVFKVDTVIIDGQSLRSFHTVILPEMNGLMRVRQDTLTYTEKIGCYSVYPQFWHLNTFDEVIDMICDYGDSTFSGFYAGLNQGCLSSIGNMPSDNVNFELSPNPATSFVTITADNTLLGNLLYIRDISGHLVYETRLISATTKLSTETLPCGLYFINIDRGGYIKTQKLLIQH